MKLSSDDCFFLMLCEKLEYLIQLLGVLFHDLIEDRLNCLWSSCFQSFKNKYREIINRFTLSKTVFVLKVLS